jgi:hypothetical protein
MQIPEKSLSEILFLPNVLWVPEAVTLATIDKILVPIKPITLDEA